MRARLKKIRIYGARLSVGFRYYKLAHRKREEKSDRFRALPYSPNLESAMQVKVWSDYACRFCWIGEARLARAIRELGLDNQVTMVHKAFELNPDAPKTTSDNALATISKRYNMPVARILAEFTKIAEMAAEDGITLNQKDTIHTNTADAHRLMKLFVILCRFQGLDEGWKFLESINYIICPSLP